MMPAGGGCLGGHLSAHHVVRQVGGVWVAPIYSWYHASFDREPDIPGAPAIENARALHRGLPHWLSQDTCNLPAPAC